MLFGSSKNSKEFGRIGMTNFIDRICLVIFGSWNPNEFDGIGMMFGLQNGLDELHKLRNSSFPGLSERFEFLSTKRMVKLHQIPFHLLQSQINSFDKFQFYQISFCEPSAPSGLSKEKTQVACGPWYYSTWCPYVLDYHQSVLYMFK